MSLINQMLKDLEKRRATAINPDGSVLQGVSWPGWRENQSRSGTTVLLIVLLCTAISAAGFIWYQDRKNSAVEFSVPTLAAESTSASPVDRLAHRQAVLPVVVVESETVKLSPLSDANKTVVITESMLASEENSGAEPQTTVASIAPSNTMALDVLVSADARSVEANAVGRAKPEPIAKEGNNSRSMVTKISRPVSSEKQAEIRYQRALHYYRANQYSLVEPELRKTLALDAGHIAARELLVAMLIRGGRYTGADKVLAEGLEIFPHHLSLTQLKARMLMQQGDTAAAIQVLESNEPAIEAEPAYHALRAALYQRSGQHENAVDIYASLVSLPDATPAWWVGYAISQEALGQPVSALESYRHAAASVGLNGKLHAYVSDKIRQLGSQ